MKYIIMVIVAVVIGLAAFAFLTVDNSALVGTDTKSEQTQKRTEETQYGVAFTYLSGKDAYTLVRPEEGVRKDLVFTESLFFSKSLETVAQNSEYPESLTIEVYRNPMNLDIETWIQENERSNFSLSVDGQLQKKQLGTTDFTFYTYDGLYRTDVYAYAQEGFVYLFSNMWSDSESVQKKDMEEVVASVQWGEPAISAQVAHGDIVVATPEFRGVIESPLIVQGMARGTWFFEASFPITLVNWDGLIIAEGYAQAQGDWMTEDLVPWTAEIAFTKPDFDERGYLILQKDNPSGLPENDDSIEIPILFK